MKSYRKIVRKFVDQQELQLPRVHWNIIKAMSPASQQTSRMDRAHLPEHTRCCWWHFGQIDQFIRRSAWSIPSSPRFRERSTYRKISMTLSHSLETMHIMSATHYQSDKTIPMTQIDSFDLFVSNKLSSNKYTNFYKSKIFARYVRLESLRRFNRK